MSADPALDYGYARLSARLAARPDAAELVLTAAGVVAVAAADRARVRDADARDWYWLYRELCGVRAARGGAAGRLAFPGGRAWTWAALAARLRAGYGLDARYVVAPGAPLPPPRRWMRARRAAWDALYGAVRARRAAP